MIKLMAEPGEEWAVYYAWAGEVPDDADLEHLDGVLLTGSG